ncbi:bile acid:sodium symporter family protein [Propionimicrobium lymphophilum]|uniref:bile acid:sodium symporter family protein n=1 Tax=Propionimicrobium lymphophilum TaxID=33012 RepID=UPI002551286F|nr:bile acid:sodium symporter family protein [Propionimicrobium lymphophilum]MDK7709792.1 bile acid:sodium symporter family protein [Propionimicrobium lymphophilum]MDK7733946.1 bile acid:sodium symporter family protein [Propionimicrobium lymphophilum]
MLEKIDWFLTGIIAFALLGTFLPAPLPAMGAVDWLAKIMIAILFFLYGVRLKPEETIAGLKHWRLHATILSYTYVVFPIIGILIGFFTPGLISTETYRGLLWVCLLPSTVQSSINFTSIARGNVAGAIVSASASNLLGVFITPVLALLLMSTTGLKLQASSILDIAAQILLPFLLGQFSRQWTADFVARHPKLKYFDQASILVVVYKAFSQSHHEGIWGRTNIYDLIIICIFSVVVLAFMLWITWEGARVLGFNRADQIAIQFCGTKKSLATGVPMASVLFSGGVGLIVLPLMVFHQVQLIACGALSSHYAVKDEEWHQEPGRRG